MDTTIALTNEITPKIKELLYLADPSEEMLQEYLPQGDCFCLRSGDKALGVMVLLKTRPKTLEIMNIAVREDFQNRGLGMQLLQFAIQTARKRGINTLEIGTGNPGVQQLYLYQKAGFRIVGIDFDYFRRIFPEPIFEENGLECRDMIRLQMEL